MTAYDTLNTIIPVIDHNGKHLSSILDIVSVEYIPQKLL